MVQAIVRQITLRKNYLAGERFVTIYFRGGTPSLLNSDQLQLLLDTINEKQSEFSRVFEMIKAATTVKIDESTFAFNKDQKAVQKGSPAAPSGTATKIPVGGVKVSTPTEPIKPTKTEQDKTLEKIANLLKELNSTMQDVADNTSPKLATTGNMIDN